MRGSNAWRINKDDPSLEKRRRIAYFHRRNPLLVARIGRFRDVVCQRTQSNLLALPCAVEDGSLWNYAISNLRDHGSHGKNARWQDFRPKKRIDEGTFASLHLAENGQMKLIRGQFLFKRKQLLAQTCVACATVLHQSAGSATPTPSIDALRSSSTTVISRLSSASAGCSGISRRS